MRITSKIDVLGLDLDNTLTFRMRPLPWWCSAFLVPFFMILPPNKSMLNMIRKFKSSGGKIIIISARPSFFTKISKLWLKRYNVPYHKIKCVGFIDRNRQKLQVIRTENVDCFIDDDWVVRQFVGENEPFVKILSPSV